MATDRPTKLDLRSGILIGAFVLATATLYRTVGPRLVLEWWDDPNFSHGFLVPVFSFYLIWERRRELRFFPDGEESHLGFFLVLAGVLALIVGKAGVEDFSMRSSLVLTICGGFAILFGRTSFRAFLFPLLFLFFMVPVPYLIYDTLAFPLKMIASRIGEASLSGLGVPVLREGNVIILPNMELEVADACSGIRSVVSLMAFATASSYFLGIGALLGAIMVVTAVPVSIATNSMRIVITGLLAGRYGEAAAAGFFHEFSGLVIFLLGALIIFGTCVVLRRLQKPSRSHSSAVGPPHDKQDVTP